MRSELLILLREIRDLLRESRGPRGYGPCDLLTEEQAARLLRMSDADARAWLEARGLIRRYAGRRRVVAGELIAAHDAAQTAPPKPAARRRGEVASLDSLRL